MTHRHKMLANPFFVGMWLSKRDIWHFMALGNTCFGYWEIPGKTESKSLRNSVQASAIPRGGEEVHLWRGGGGGGGGGDEGGDPGVGPARGAQHARH